MLSFIIIKKAIQESKPMQLLNFRMENMEP